MPGCCAMTGCNSRAAGDRDIGAALRRPRDVAGELDHVAIALVGDQQQRAVRPAASPSHCGRSVGGISGGALPSLMRHSYSSQPRAKSPRSSEASAMPKCAPGKFGSSAQRALAAGDRLVELEPVVMQDAEIVVAVDVVGRERRGAAAGDQRVVEPAEHAVDLADDCGDRARSSAPVRSSAPSARPPRRSGPCVNATMPSRCNAG